jgi:hypothetical protein
LQAFRNCAEQIEKRAGGDSPLFSAACLAAILPALARIYLAITYFLSD